MIGALGTLARHGRPDILLYFGRSPGDSLLCTAVLHELRARGAGRLWMQSDQPELFEGNADVDRVVPYDRSIRRLTRILGGRVVFPDYAPYDAAADRSRPPDRHIIACMCRALGVTGEVGLRPYLSLAEDERRLGRLARRQVAMQSTGASARLPMRNKEWGAERFQAVARELRSRYDLVQLGTPADPPLDGAIDERGAPLRRAAAILSQSIVFVGLVGFLMHLARAVECRSVIVYGGREAPWQSGYTGNENLAAEVPCSPCWLWNRCDYDRRCLAEITPDEVVAAVDRATARSGERLAVDAAAL